MSKNIYTIRNAYVYRFSKIKEAFSLIGCDKLGFYGVNCSIPCPANCLDKLCHVVKGTCLKCVKGFKGKLCNEGKRMDYLKKYIFKRNDIYVLLTLRTPILDCYFSHISF